MINQVLIPKADFVIHPTKYNKIRYIENVKISQNQRINIPIVFGEYLALNARCSISGSVLPTELFATIGSPENMLFKVNRYLSRYK